MIYPMRTDSYPAWHPLIHHSFVLCFLLTMVLLPVLYIKLRQPPYWVLLLIFCSFVVIYATYWVFLCLIFRVPLPHHDVEPSTVAIPPSSHRVHHSSSTLRPNAADQHSADSSHAVSIDIPPTYEMALSQAAVELPPNSPPSYHSAKEDEESRHSILSEDTHRPHTA